MNRRHALTIVGSALATSFAGCSSNSAPSAAEDDGQPDKIDFDEEAPPRLELLAFELPNEITYLDEFEGEITVGNTGGEPVEEDAMVEFVQSGSDNAGQSVEINVSKLESGETRTHAIGPFTATAAGEFRFEAGGSFTAVRDGVDDPITVVPREIRLGEGVETSDDLRLTVTDITYEDALLYYEESTFKSAARLRKTLADRIIAVPRITVENASGSSIGIPETLLTLKDGSPITEVEPAHIDGPDVRGYTVEPGEAPTGYIASVVDTEAVGDLQLELDLVGDSTTDVVVDLGEDVGLPQFELVDQTVPNQFTDSTEEHTFEVANTGDAAGTFRGVVEFSFSEKPSLFAPYIEDVWYADYFEAVVEEIPPGESAEFSFTTDYSDDEEYLQNVDVHYRFQPFEYEWTVAAYDSE